MRSAALLSRAKSRLLIIDMQTRILSVMEEQDAVIDNCVRLIHGAKLLCVPCEATEQYPRGLGPTTDAIAELIPERPDKLRFSCVECLDWAAESQTPETRHQVVLAGIEAHVCVLQTAFDLMSLGFEVAVVADAVTSRKETDYDLALARLSDAGASLVTTEMVLFEWCEVAGTDEFKQISQRLAR